MAIGTATIHQLWHAVGAANNMLDRQVHLPPFSFASFCVFEEGSCQGAWPTLLPLLAKHLLFSETSPFPQPYVLEMSWAIQVCPRTKGQDRYSTIILDGSPMSSDMSNQRCFSEQRERQEQKLPVPFCFCFCCNQCNCSSLLPFLLTSV